MRAGLLFVAALAACSSKAAAPHSIAIEDVIAAEATGILRSNAGSAPLIDALTNLLGTPPECWTKLRAGVRDVLQVEEAAQSYQVLVGVPRLELEVCARESLTKFGLELERDGELTRFRSRLGGGVARWAGDVAVIGTPDAVSSAFAAKSPAARKQWRDRLAALPRAQFAVWRTDHLFGVLFGDDALSWQLVLTKLERKPTLQLHAELRASFADAAAASRVAAKWSAGELATAMAPPAGLADAIKRVPLTIDGATLSATIEDLHAFDGVQLDLPTMQQWVLQLLTGPAMTGSAGASGATPAR